LVHAVPYEVVDGDLIDRGRRQLGERLGQAVREDLLEAVGVPAVAQPCPGVAELGDPLARLPSDPLAAAEWPRCPRDILVRLGTQLGLETLQRCDDMGGEPAHPAVL